MTRIKSIIAATLCVLFFGGAALAQFVDKAPIPDVPRDQVVCFAMYAVGNNTLKLTAQFYPLKEGEPRKAALEIKKGENWEKIAESDIPENGWAAVFRVEKWDSSRDYEYRVNHADTALYTGIIKKDPVDKEEIVVVAFTGNSINKADGGSLPKTDIVENIKKLNPDLLFFSGDQIYDHNRHYAGWLKFGRDFGDAIRNIPTVSLPDDHDVGNANLWGAGGKKSGSEMGVDGGYNKSFDYVREVYRAQTSNLPDPYDPTPMEEDVPVWYTSLNIGRVSFAIIEDREFKTGPLKLVSKPGLRPDIIVTPDYDPASLDVPEAVLLGERQHKFLRDWGADWRGADMKAVLSATIFAGASTHAISPSQRVYADFDSNGWPQTGRNQALREIRKSFAFMLAGDQHLATLIHHGVEDWNDAGYSFSVPSIANFFLRYWLPDPPGANRDPNMPAYTGEYLDGFGNKMTMLAVANPDATEGSDKLRSRAAGYGVVRFNKKSREIKVECWPRNVDVSAPGAEQYPGWPQTLKMEDNYGRKAVAWLPTIEISGMNNPVVQIIDESNDEVVYTLRINGASYDPKVFKEGMYTIKVGNQDTENIKVFKNVKSNASKAQTILKAQF